LLKVINEILEVSKIEVGRRELNENAFPLNAVFNSSMMVVQPKADMGKVKITNDIPKDLPNIYAEELAFKQVLVNLLNNAVQFTPEGGEVTVRAKMNGTGKMYIEVSDTGVGIPEDQIEKAMSPFGQVNTDLSRDSAGTGLGLTIVEALLHMHGADFQLFSKEGQGTTARITVPVERVLQKSSKKTVH